MNTHSAYIITGPTASGKSSFAHELARRIHGAIINCDSVQIYHGIENISASPFAGRAFSPDIDGVSYRLFSVLTLDKQISVADYIKMAHEQYDSVVADGYVPIFVGGTGFYVNGIINGISPIPEVSEKNRNRARELVATDLESARAMVQTCNATDPQRLVGGMHNKVDGVKTEGGRHFLLCRLFIAVVNTPAAWHHALASIKLFARVVA